MTSPVFPVIGPRDRFATLFDVPLSYPLVWPNVASGADDWQFSWIFDNDICDCGDEDCIVDGICYRAVQCEVEHLADYE